MKLGYFLLNFCCSSLLIFCSSGGHRGGQLSASAYVETDSVNLEHRYQTIGNFGASDAWIGKALGCWSDAGKNKIADLALANASAWQWWMAVSTVNYEDGLLYTDWKKRGDPESILVSKTFWALGNFSRFIRPGMQRIELRGEDHRFNGLLGSAYVGTEPHTLVLVYMNVSQQVRLVSWEFGDSSNIPERFTPYVTSETQNLAEGETLSSSGVGSIPARSMVSFVADMR